MSDRNRQDQRVGDNATANQAARDVIIHQGADLEDVARITTAIVAQQLIAYQAEARATAEERYAEIKEDILEAFGAQKRGNAEAFKDPNFQGVLSDAANAYARSGDDEVKDTLVDLIARRSNVAGGTRIALVLAEAAAKVPLLTSDEFGLLSLIYCIRYAELTMTNASQFSTLVATRWRPLINPSLGSQSSIWHLDSLSCGRPDVREVLMIDIIRQVYGGILTRGLTREEIDQALPGRETSFDKFLCLSEVNYHKLRPIMQSAAKFKASALKAGLPDADADIIWGQMAARIPNKQELLQAFPAIASDLNALFDLWDNTQIKNISLTSVGIAIAHANICRNGDFDAPLEIWIQ